MSNADLSAKKEAYRYQRIYERDKFTCRYCGWDGKQSFQHFFIAGFSIDHIKPKRFGGTNDDSNLVLACHSCNLYKRGHDCNSFEEAREFVLQKHKEVEAWYSRFVTK